MNDNRDDELTREEREAFRLLAESRELADRTEDSVVGALRERGLIDAGVGAGGGVAAGAAGTGKRRGAAWVRYGKGLAIAASIAAAFMMGTQYGRTTGGYEASPVSDPLPTSQTRGNDVRLVGGKTGPADDLDDDLFLTAINCDDPEFIYDPRCFSVKTVGWQ